uniref:hypothetical protein RF2 n=1 Tax=Hydnora triceps TaxID=2952647 RepID=UPI0021156024|nr:hypothetical protein RF2 [Hydnora triceps]USN93679.1 hypothetical protein RF2 [Hydnora triceps]
MKKTTIKFIILEIREILRELYIKKYFITIFFYMVKLLDQLKKILIILVMYIILFICAYRRDLVKPIIYIKKSLSPLTKQFELNNVISKLDSTTYNLISEIYKNKEEIKSLDTIDNITLNLLFALSNSTGVFKKKIENRKYISSIGEKTIYEHLRNCKKENLPLKFKLKKKICEFRDEVAHPYQYIQDETRRQEIDLGLFVGINLGLKDFPLKLDFSELNVYVSVPVSNSKSIIIFRYGLFFKKVVKKVKKLIRKTSKKDNFSSLSFRFFETNNNNDKLNKNNLCLILLKKKYNLELNTYKEQLNYIINYTINNINLVENKNISLVKINFIEDIINYIISKTYNYKTNLYELKKLYKNEIKKEECNLYENEKSNKKHIDIYKQCITYFNTYGTLLYYLDSYNNLIVNRFFKYNFIFQSNFYRNINIKNINININMIPILMDKLYSYVILMIYNALTKSYSYLTIIILDRLYPYIIIIGFNILSKLYSHIKRISSNALNKLYSYITKKDELVYKDKNDISVSKINFVNIRYLQSKRFTNIKEKNLILLSPSEYTSYNLKSNDITLLHYFIVQNSNFVKISNYNKYLINLKINNNNNNYKYFIETFINFNKKYLKKKKIINLKNFIQNFLINDTYKLNSYKKYKRIELSKIQQKYSFNVDFENSIYLQLEKANYKYNYEYIADKNIFLSDYINPIYDKSLTDIYNNSFKNNEYLEQKKQYMYSLHTQHTHTHEHNYNRKNNLIEKLKHTHERIVNDNIENNLIEKLKSNINKKDINISYFERKIIKNKNIIENIINNKIILFTYINNINLLKKDLYNLINLIINFININKNKIYILILLLYQIIYKKCYIFLCKNLPKIYIWIYNQEKNNIFFFAQIKLTEKIILIKEIIKNTLIKSKQLSRISSIEQRMIKKNYNLLPPTQLEILIYVVIVFIIFILFKYIFEIIYNLNQLYEQIKILKYLIIPVHVDEARMLYTHTKEDFLKCYDTILINITKAFISFINSLLDYHNIFIFRSYTRIRIKKAFIRLFSSIISNLISLIKNLKIHINFSKYATYFSYKGKFLYFCLFDQKKMNTEKGYLYNNIEHWITNSYFINNKEKNFIIQFMAINKHKKINNIDLNNFFFKKYEQPGYKYLYNLINKKYNYNFDIYNIKFEERRIFLANNYINLYPHNNKQKNLPFPLSFIYKQNILVIDNENEDFLLIKSNIIKNPHIPFVTLTTYYEDMIANSNLPFFTNFESFRKRKIRKNTLSNIDEKNKVFEKFVCGDKDNMLDDLIIDNITNRTFNLFFQLELINTISPCIVWIPNIHEYNMNYDYYEISVFNFSPFLLRKLANIISHQKKTLFIASTFNLKKMDPVFIRPNCLSKCLLLRKPTNILDQRKYLFNLLESKGFYLENIKTINNNLLNSKGIRDLFTLSNETILLSIINKNNNIINDDIIQFSRHKQFHTYFNIPKTPLNFTLYQIGQAFIQIIFNYSPLNDPISIYTNFLTKDYFYRYYFSLCTNITKINLCFYIFKCYAGFIINKMWYSLEKFNLLLTCNLSSNVDDFNLFYALLKVEKTILLDKFDSNNYDLDTLVNYAPKDWFDFLFENESKKELFEDKLLTFEDQLLTFEDQLLTLYKDERIIPASLRHNWSYMYSFNFNKENHILTDFLKYPFADLRKMYISKNNIYNEFYYYSFLNQVVSYLHSLIYENKHIFEKIMLVLSEKGWVFPEEIKTIISDFVIKKF